MNNITYLYNYNILGVKVGDDKLSHFASFRITDDDIDYLGDIAEEVLNTYSNEEIEEYETMFVVNVLNKVAEYIIFITPKEELKKQLKEDEDFLEWLEDEGLTFEEGLEMESVFWVDCVEWAEACRYADLIGMNVNEYDELVSELYRGRREAKKDL